MQSQRLWVLDFETEGIEDRPSYPPKPVGLSYIEPGKDAPVYIGWGHPDSDPGCIRAAQDILRRAYEDSYASRAALLFHNAKFDLEVAEKHFGVRSPEWYNIHDTLFLLFLDDPHASEIALKPSAQRLLNWPAEEQSDLYDYIKAHVFTSRPGGEGTITVAVSKPPGMHYLPTSKLGAFIAYAPERLVGRYANGDTLRTLRLFELLYPKIQQLGMDAAYRRERRLLPVLMENERRGIRVDIDALVRDIPVFEAAQERADSWLRRRLHVGDDFNFDADQDVADALIRAGVVDKFATTASGKRSTSKKTLTRDTFKDEQVFYALGFRQRLETCLNTFARPWLARATQCNGYMSTTWNQVRGADYGTRTGRPSTHNPNYLNVPKSFSDKNDGYRHPDFIDDLPELPLMRKYLLPDEGEVWAHADFNQQELRLVAHFEDGDLCAAYNADPNLDIHTYVRSSIKELLGIDIGRLATKGLNFGYLYGMGISSLANTLRVTPDRAAELRHAQMQAMPGLKRLTDEIKRLSKLGEPIRTWGGRLYYCEQPKVVDGKVRTFEYKLLNYLVQGSAADITKESIISYYERKQHGRFLVSVYDENNISVPENKLKSELRLLAVECMQSVKVDVPMLTECKAGTSWGNLIKFEIS